MTFAAKKPQHPTMQTGRGTDTYINKNVFARPRFMQLGQDSEGPSRPGPILKGHQAWEQPGATRGSARAGGPQCPSQLVRAMVTAIQPGDLMTDSSKSAIPPLTSKKIKLGREADATEGLKSGGSEVR